MKVAVIVQRYGADVVGGAETHCRQVVEKLVHSLGWEVEVWTSTAIDYVTWANYYPSGDSMVNGIKVKRFKTQFPRYQKFFGLVNRIFPGRIIRWSQAKRFSLLTRVCERLWFLLQGPYCPGLIREIKRRRAEYDQFIFYTYLYYPTVIGLTYVADKSLLLATAHDEAPFYFPAVAQLLKKTKKILVNTEPEKDLILRRMANDSAIRDKIQMTGLGFDNREFEDYLAKDREINQKSKPTYLFYLGRIGHGKNIPELVDWFLDYKSKFPASPLQLWLAGKFEGDYKLPDQSSMKYCGFIDEREKIRLISNAVALVNPSQHESLSMIVIEAIALQVPVIVNRHCQVFKYYSDQLKTVFSYGDEAELHSIIDRLMHNHETNKWSNELLLSKKWVEDRYSWRQVLNAIQHASGVQNNGMTLSGRSSI